jgi:hypothetical protein
MAELPGKKSENSGHAIKKTVDALYFSLSHIISRIVTSSTRE